MGSTEVLPPLSHMLHGTGILTYIWLKLMVNVGKYSSPMESLGLFVPDLTDSFPGNHPVFSGKPTPSSIA